MDPKPGRYHDELTPVPPNEDRLRAAVRPLAPAGGGVTFLDVTLDLRRQVLVRGGEEIRLRPRSYDVIAYLAANSGRLISKRELTEAVWGETAVTDDSLVQCLVEIRRALGSAQHVVQTVRGRGYLLDAAVLPVPAAEANLRPPASSTASSVGERPLTEQRTEPGDFRRRSVPWTYVGAGVVVVVLAVTAWWVIRSGRRAQVPTVSALSPIRAIAVLPLENLSHDPGQDFFAEGMTDELTTQVAKIPSVRVIARTSASRFKGTGSSLAEIARELHVDAVVEGTITRSAGRVRIAAQVIQVSTEAHLWAESYDRPLSDVVVLEKELALEIARAIRVVLTPEERLTLSATRTVVPAAHEALLKGQYYWSRRTEATTRRALQYFQEAIDQDPTYAPAYVGLADSHLSLALAEALQEVVPPREAFSKARVAAVKALEIDDSLAAAHATLGHIQFQYDRDWSGADRSFRRAIELNPSYANAHHWWALSLMWAGRLDQARDEIARARELDPLSLVINANVGFVWAAAGRYAEAIEQCRRTLDLDPHFAQAQYRLGQIYLLSGDAQDAIGPLREAVSLSGSSPRAAAELGLAYALSGDRGRARAVLDELRAQSKARYVSSFDYAVVQGGLGDDQAALIELERAYQEGSPSLSLLNLSPAFARLRSKPRFAALVQHVGLPGGR